MSVVARLGAWTLPLTFASLAARVFSGQADAPIVVLLVVVAPLVALLRRDERLPASPVAAVLALPGVALVLWANVLLLVDFARVRGVDRAAALSIVLLLLVVASAMASAWPDAAGAPLVVVGVASVVATVVLLGVAAGAPPWTAWARAASRPALVFAGHDVSTTAGRALLVPATLTFTEAHRVTAVVAASVTVFESDNGRVTVRERRLTDGESLALQAGDRLALAAGTRIRFEPGKRVPSPLPSGIAWADVRDPRGRRAAPELAGVALTMLGGALALVPPAGASRRVASIGSPLLVAVFGLGAAAWGIFAMDLAPDLLVGASVLTPLADLPPVAARRTPLGPLVVVALAALFVAAAIALCARVALIVGVRTPAAGARRRVAVGAWALVSVVALLGGLWPLDAWRVLLGGFGLLAVTWTAPALARGGERATVTGAIVGAIAFGVLTVAGRVGAVPVSIAAYPALVAAPLAWVAARVATMCPDPRGS